MRPARRFPAFAARSRARLRQHLDPRICCCRETRQIKGERHLMWLRRLLHFFYISATLRSVAQPGSAPASGAGGRRFESSRSDQSINAGRVAFRGMTLRRFLSKLAALSVWTSSGGDHGMPVHPLSCRDNGCLRCDAGIAAFLPTGRRIWYSNGLYLARSLRFR